MITPPLISTRHPSRIDRTRIDRAHVDRARVDRHDIWDSWDTPEPVDTPTVVDTDQPTGPAGRSTPTRHRRDLLGRLGPALVGIALGTIWVTPGPSTTSRLVLTVFLVAIVLWTATDLDDTLVALGAAAVATVVVGDTGAFEAALGSGTVWLLVASFVMAAAVQRSGLATVAVTHLLRRSGSVSSLCWRATAGLGALSFVVPATSGRAALAMPLYVALARNTPDPRVRRAVSLVFPTTILLSAASSLLGAGAHLVAIDLVAAAGGDRIGFLHWAVLAVPFTLLSCAAGTAAILHLFLDPHERRRPVVLDGEDLPTAPLDHATTRRVLVVLATVLTAWCTAGLHGIDPALVAVAGAVAVCAPGRGGTRLDHALAEVPWHLVLFLAATTALGTALVSSGAAGWIGGSALRNVGQLPDALVVAGVVAASLLAHLVVGSRSARAAVLVPMVIAVAASTGLDMTGLVFASTIAAGYCLTLPVSAKPVAMFQHPFGTDRPAAYDVGDLVRLSSVLVPLHLVLVTTFSVVVWPVLGLPV